MTNKKDNANKQVGCGSFILLLLIIFIIAFSISFYIEHYVPTIQQESRANLAIIGKAIQTYRNNNEQRYPLSLDKLVTYGYLNKDHLIRPGNENKIQLTNGKLSGTIDYIFFLNPPKDTTGYEIMGYEKTKYAYNDSIGVVYYNGSTSRISTLSLNAQLKAEGRGPAE